MGRGSGIALYVCEYGAHLHYRCYTDGRQVKGINGLQLHPLGKGCLSVAEISRQRGNGKEFRRSVVGLVGPPDALLVIGLTRYNLVANLSRPTHRMDDGGIFMAPEPLMGGRGMNCINNQRQCSTERGLKTVLGLTNDKYEDNTIVKH